MTEAERKAELKDQSSKFVRQHRIVKRLVIKTNSFFTNISVDAKALKATEIELYAAFNDLCEIYDLICKTTADVVPASIDANFKKIEPDSSALLDKVYSKICKLIDSDLVSSRYDVNSDSFVTPAVAPAAQSEVVNILCEQVVLVCLH